MLTTRLGSRRTPVVPLDRGSVGVTLTEHRPEPEQPRSFRLRIVLDTASHDVSSYDSHTETHIDAFPVVYATPTIDEGVPPQKLWLGDIITYLYDDCEVAVQALSRDSYKDRPATFVDYQGGCRYGTWIAFDDLSTFTVRLPRPPVDEQHPDDV